MAEVIRVVAVVAPLSPAATDLAVAVPTLGEPIRVVAAEPETTRAAATIMAMVVIIGTAARTAMTAGTVMAADTVMATGTEASWPFFSVFMDGISRR